MRKIASALEIAALVLASFAAGCGDDGSSNDNPMGMTTQTANTGTPDTGVSTMVPPASTDAGTSTNVGNTNTGTLDAGMVGSTTGIKPAVDSGAVDTGVALGDASSDSGSVAVGDGGGVISPVTPIMRGDAPTKASATAKGPYKVMSYTSGFPVTLYGGGTIWYPTDAEAPFGAVAICPGFTAAQSSIMNWGPFLASHGIVALTMDTATPLDVVDQRADELMDALASIKSENDRAASPIYKKIDTMRLGVMGWSMGGGGTWLAADMHPELRSAVTFAGHIVTAVNQDVSMVHVPTLMFAGSADNAILGGGMSQGVYDGIPESTPKMVWEIMGAGHDVANDPANTSGAVGRYGLSWEKVYLEGDMRYRQFLLEMPPTASYFKTNVK
jgi:dienelactone hydrolase